MSRRSRLAIPAWALLLLTAFCWLLITGLLLSPATAAGAARSAAGDGAGPALEPANSNSAARVARSLLRATQPGASASAAQPALRPGFSAPPAGEERLVRNEVVLEITDNVSTQTLEEIARRHHLTRMGSQSFGLTGRTLYRWRIDDGRAISDVIRDLQGEEHISAAQPNYIFTLQDPAPGAGPRSTDALPQYSVAKLHLNEAHHLATGARVPVALIDSAVDAAHPELQGVIAASFDALGGPASPDAHGTAMAGAIAAHAMLVGAAPRVRLLTVRAFGDVAAGAKATSFGILRGIDWAVSQGAKVLNMSFAGPADPALKEALASAYRKGLVLIAAAGNGGPKSPPLYPAADSHVIAVTATDAQDRLLPQANRGSYIALAAPGVDVLVPAPNGGMQLTSGTSVAAAQVSGIAALMLERNPALGPQGIRKILTSTARHLGAKARDNEFGAGLANALQAVKAVESKSGEQLSSELPSAR